MKRLYCLLYSFLLFCATGFSQSSPAKSSVADCKTFFLSDAPLEMVMTSDFKKLRSQQKKDIYQNAFVSIKFNDHDSLSDTVRVCARGEMRRQVCQVPSLMVDFKNKKGSPLNKLKKLKMVCGCSGSSYDEGLLLSEFLVYKMYNLLTEISFRVRLVNITYRDLANKIKPYSQHAFFIEDVDEMAARNHCREFEKSIQTVYTNRSQATLMTIFQYMIGNTDWSVPNFHNMKLVQSKQDSLSAPFVVPYDFDFSGIVDASYAFPNQDLFSIEHVTDRYYRGLPSTEEEVELVLNNFRKNKEKFIKLVKDFELLKLSERERMVSYIEDFYKTVNNHSRVDYHFVRGMSQ